jgi:sulfate adenylyltransferase subunit 2
MVVDSPSVRAQLDALEAESLQIFREVAAGCKNPIMLYSIGKDSSVLLHLLRKAFWPATPPIPLMHIDTGWKFQEMIRFRDAEVARTGVELRVYRNESGVQQGINPITHGASMHTEVMKTQALKQALSQFQFDAAIGGARRDEEKSRAKERIFSHRDALQRWDPRWQRPELFALYNTQVRAGESLRVFPLSNWTELDVWRYIHREQIPVAPLYFAAERPVVMREGMMIVRDDHRMPLLANEQVENKLVRFRTLGCYPLTAAVESTATDVASIIIELQQAKTSERAGRLIDFAANDSMEKKKREGYF